MKLDQILLQIGISSYVSIQEIHGGNDSAVYKVDLEDGRAFALRLLPSKNYHQFALEKDMIELAKENGIPVPKVYSVMLIEDYSAMLMEWATGRTVFDELISNPQNAKNLGVEFGKIQALINKINLPISSEYRSSTWLAPDSNEAEVLKQISSLLLNKNKSLIHLDYHPLNVLTDGQKVTAVIDWANASFDDYRFDIARTSSILQLEGYKYFADNPSVIAYFEQGWKEGYESEFGSMEVMPLFQIWAGLRMKRDLGERLSQTDSLRIDQWMKNQKSWRHGF